MNRKETERIDPQVSEMQAVRRREQMVVGDPPRIEPLTSKDVIDTAIRSTQQIRKAAGSSTPVTAADVPEMMTTMLRHPDLFARIADLSMQLLGKGALPPRDRQLAVLRISWLCQGPYVWGEHVKHSKRIGLTSEEIERITRGWTVPGWDEHEQAILRAVEELYESAMITDDTWKVLSKHWDERQLIELPVLVGQFTTVMYLQNAVKLRLGSENIGLSAR
jgi:4-carboxymuconolactone decarboxylase